MKLDKVVKIKEFFSIKRMKIKNFVSFLFSVILCVTFILADGDQNIETQVPTKQVQNSSLASSQDNLLKALTAFLRRNVPEDATEEVPESIITDINQESTDNPSSTELMNVTSKLSILPKRYVMGSTPDAIPETEFFLDQSYWVVLTIEQLENYSCIHDASSFGHKEAIGVLFHEALCEFGKLWHYILIAIQNVKEEFQLDLPLETEEAIILFSDFLFDEDIFDKIEEGIVQFEVFLANPENLNALVEVLEKCIPISNIHESLNRLRIAISNFFIRLQGLVIYFEPHYAIENYVELFKEWDAQLCAAIQEILELFGINLETEVDLLSEFITSVRWLLKNLSFEESFERNVEIFKQFIDTLFESFTQYHGSVSLDSVFGKFYTLISNYISTFLKYDVNIPVIQLLLPNKDTGIFSFNWQIRNETSSSSHFIISKENLTSIFGSELLNIFEIEAEFFWELSSLVKDALEKISSEENFDERLAIFKDFITELLKIYKKYLECTGPLNSEVHTFISSIPNLLSKDFEIPLARIKLTNGTGTLSFIWQITNGTSSFPLHGSVFNATSIIKNITHNWSKSLGDKGLHISPFFSNPVESEEPSQPSDSTIKSSDSAYNSWMPHGIFQTTISPTSSDEEKSNDKSQSFWPSTLFSPDTMSQEDSSESDSSTMPTSNNAGTTSSNPSTPTRPKPQNNQRSSIFWPFGTTNDISRNNPTVFPSFTNLPNTSGNNLPMPSSTPEEPDDSFTDNPSTPSSNSEQPTNFWTNYPEIPSSVSEQTSNSMSNNPSEPSSTTQEPFYSFTDNPATPSSNSEQPTDFWTNYPEIPSSDPEQSYNFVSNNPSSSPSGSEMSTNSRPHNRPSPTSAPGKSTNSMPNSPSRPSSTPDMSTNSRPHNTPRPTHAPGKPTNSMPNSPSRPSSTPDMSTNSGPHNRPSPTSAPGRPTNSMPNSPSRPSSAPDMSTNSGRHNRPSPTSAPGRPTNSMPNSPSRPSSAPDMSTNSGRHNRPTPTVAPGRPTNSMPNSPSRPSSTPDMSTNSGRHNRPSPTSAPGRPTNSMPNSPSRPSSTPDMSTNSGPHNRPSPTSAPGRSTNSMPNSPSRPSSTPDMSTNSKPHNTHKPTHAPGKPTNSMPNSPSRPSSTPDMSTNSGPHNRPSPTSVHGKPTTPMPNNPSRPSSTPEEPVDAFTNNPATPSYNSEQPTDFWTNYPEIPSSAPEQSFDFVSNNPSSIPGVPVHSSTSNPGTSSSNSKKPTNAPSDNTSNSPASHGKSTDMSSNNSSNTTPYPPIPYNFWINTPQISPVVPINSPNLLDNTPPIYPYMHNIGNNPPMYPSSYGRPAEYMPFSPGRSDDFNVNNPPIYPYLVRRPIEFSNDAPMLVPSPRQPSPSVIILDRDVNRGHEELYNPYIPPDYLIPASSVVPIFSQYQLYANPYVNYQDPDAFYKNPYAYLQYGNPVRAPPPSMSNQIFESLGSFSPSFPMSMNNHNRCGTSTSVSSLSGLNSILKNDMKMLHVPLHLPRKEIQSALGNSVLSPGDIIVIFPKNDVGLIGQVMDAVSPIYFKAYGVKTNVPNSHDGIKIWHLRSGDFRNPECEQQLESIFPHRKFK